MGMFRKSSSCSACSSQPSCNTCGKVDPLPNPNPRNFRIVKTQQFGKALVVLIKYPDCTNYEGNKIILFENLKKEAIWSATFIDPHFTKGYLSPFARFEPTELGWSAACYLADNLFGG